MQPTQLSLFKHCLFVLVATFAVLFTPHLYAAAAIGTASATVVVAAPISIVTHSDYQPVELPALSSSPTATSQAVKPSAAADKMTSSVASLQLAGPPSVSFVSSEKKSAASNASFLITGDSTLTYEMTIPSSIKVMSNAGGAALNMLLNALPSTSALQGGTQLLSVNAALNRKQLQSVGWHIGYFLVTVNYN